MGNIDLYDLFYRNYKNKGNDADIKINNTSPDIKYLDTKYTVKECLCELKTIEPNDFDEIKFSDVRYTEFPIFDENNKYSGSNYIPVFVKEKKNIDPVEYMNRFKKFDINNLPLIDVANFLNIKVEKSNNIEPYGKYSPKENKIILGSDYILTFIHELVHAIIHFIGDICFLFYFFDPKYNEFIAEFTAIILCKIYKIKFDISYSKYYIKMYCDDLENGIPDDVINRVEIICDFVKLCKDIIEKNKTEKTAYKNCLR
jgi:hypothetical protein